MHTPFPLPLPMKNDGRGGGFGVDGEYDDYLEYLKPLRSIEGKGMGNGGAEMVREERGRETWAFQLDCENDRVLEV